MNKNDVKDKSIVVASLEKTDDKAKVLFDPKAMSKMLFLTMFHQNEIAWHGSGRKIGKGEYQIDDVFLYPHKTSPVTVQCIDNLYGQWLEKMALEEDERLDNLCLYGHSHVNMQTSPSGVDLDYQYDTIEMLQEDSFYIFIILNKRFDFFFRIADREDGLLYNSENIYIGTSDGGLRDIYEEYLEMVDPKVKNEGGKNGHK
ncbi:hypothetical protein M2140_000086 [Clostridiales Family XIII bacterium PM5-7]